MEGNQIYYVRVLKMLTSTTHFKRWKTGTTIVTIASLITSLFAPILGAKAAFAQTRFTDVPAGYWAANFIEALATRGIIAGFPDGSFNPNAPVTRAQYAAMVRNAFNRAQVRSSVSFVDVPANYWATPAINQAYTMGFLAGYPGNVFSPNQNIPRAQVLVSLANGLNFTATNPSVLQTFNDVSLIPSYAVNSIAAATENKIVVNYPNVQFLSPNQAATRADVAAFIYQALSSQGQVATINSPYIVGQVPSQPVSNRQAVLPAGSSIPVFYADAAEVVFLPEETLPITLTVQQNMVNSSGQVVIPQGSQVIGEFRPSGETSQFIAQEIVLTNGQRFPFNATSPLITETETIREGVNPAIIAGSAVFGAGAAAAIEGLTGERTINASEVLAGGAAGALAGTIADHFLGRKSFEVVKVNNSTALRLDLNADFVTPVP